jgi:hypothetical protein
LLRLQSLDLYQSGLTCNQVTLPSWVHCSN